jgi:hypothetical protein
VYAKELAETDPSNFEIYECDACGNDFCRKTTLMTISRTCSTGCASKWQSKRVSLSKDLYYYRVKVPNLLKLSAKKFHEVYEEYSWLELEVLLEMRKDPEKGRTAYYLTEKIYGVEYNKDGDLHGRVYVMRAAEKLIKKGMIKKYKEVSNVKKRGRPRTRYVLEKRVYILEMGCPYCKSHNYNVLVDTGEIQCIRCKLKWVIN